MTVFDRAVLAERAMAVDRHLRRVASRLPSSPADLQPSTDASDAVVLHLWQATEIIIDAPLAARLVKAAGFRSVVAHACESLDIARVHDVATRGPDDLRLFLAALRDRTS